MELAAGLRDKSSATTEDNSRIHCERKLDCAAYLVCCGHPCIAFDGSGYRFADPNGAVCTASTDYKAGKPIGELKQFLYKVSELKRMAELWKREQHPAPSEDREPFVMIPKAFALDETLTATDLALGLRLAALSDKDYTVYASTPRLQAMLNIGRDAVKKSRSRLVEKGYLELNRILDDRGQFKGCRYTVTSKLRRRNGGSEP